MCFSAEASFIAAAILAPAGMAVLWRAYKTDWRLVPVAALPLLFGAQQALEGGIWSVDDDAHLAAQLSLAYMFFSWLAWPVWTSFSLYFLEPVPRKPLFVIFAIFGGIFGGAQYFPYFVHADWLAVKYLGYAISYGEVELFDYILGRSVTYTLYVALIIGPLLLSSYKHIRIFGLLVFAVLIITYVFFAYAYISVFCFGGALMSLYLVWMIFSGSLRLPGAATVNGKIAALA